MSEELSREDRKKESREEVHDGSKDMKGETPNMHAALTTDNSKQQTETMEVHHHPNVEKKNFKEYFLEFLMIFLAVTLGFFAENIRENSLHAKATDLIIFYKSKYHLK